MVLIFIFFVFSEKIEPEKLIISVADSFESSQVDAYVTSKNLFFNILKATFKTYSQKRIIGSQLFVNINYYYFKKPQEYIRRITGTYPKYEAGK